jgi:hypothetical protein
MLNQIHMARFSLSSISSLYILVIAVIVLAVIPYSLKAQNKNKINIQKFETSNARLVFLDKNTSYLVPHTIRSFENALAFHEHFWGYKPSQKTNILFNDFSDVGNGGTMIIPEFSEHRVSLEYTYSVVPSNEAHAMAHEP